MKEGRDRWIATGSDLDVFLTERARSSGANDALVTDMKRLDDTHIDFDVTDCTYAQFWHALDEPELGFLLMCASDSPPTVPSIRFTSNGPRPACRAHPTATFGSRPSATSCFAVGFSASVTVPAPIERWNGKRWSLSAHPDPKS